MAKIPARLTNEPRDQAFVRLIPLACIACLLLFVLFSAAMIPGLKVNGQQRTLLNSSKLTQPSHEVGRLPDSLVIIHRSTVHGITITNVTYVPLVNATRIK